MFVWDEAKRRLNRPKHGIDFMDAEKIFRGVTFTAEDDSAPMANYGFSPSVCWKIRWSR